MMASRQKIKFIHEGQYVAEIGVLLFEDDTSWSPYMSVDDAYILDDVRNALCRGNLETAARYGSIYKMRPLAGAYWCTGR